MQKDDIKGYFERWYSNNDGASKESIFVTPSLTPRPEQSSELERYYRLEPEQVNNLIQCWIDHRNAFPVTGQDPVAVATPTGTEWDRRNHKTLTRL
ncbi:hypothetical protein CEP51_016677 [Fusarium floridanum]|uniref:Uncharacterized protein n=1 Tax=Fusarium floridanum TaxID=1325733 RepID=A0A428NIL6_9HYPO|nr:hypothetical protein CEP51_016677 [Fusarium floridanum]